MCKIEIFILLFARIINTPYAETTNQIFDMKWAKLSETPKTQDNMETLKINSSRNESYVCTIPEKALDDFVENFSYKGLPAIDFIQYLFNKEICSYRSEPYWTYELCHGKHIRQYHEIVDGPRLKLKQFVLGRMNAKEQEIVIKKLRDTELEMQITSNFFVPMKKFKNKEMPYVQIIMTHGSPCEFDKKRSRKTKIYYICDVESNHDIYSIEEVTSCEYEVILLTPLLCAHPKYRPKKTPKSVITCCGIGKSPKMPYDLLKMYTERKISKEESVKQNELVNNEEKKFKTQNSVDINSEIRDFLTGKNCISGGTGDWKYEFCYGKYINQYFYGILGMKTTVCLGKFNLEKHINWIKENPDKRPKTLEARSHINQFYSSGCINNVTGRPRQTEVKLKCLENSSGNNWNALVMYLYETNVGEYLLGIEAPILCHVILLADENGLISVKS